MGITTKKKFRKLHIFFPEITSKYFFLYVKKQPKRFQNLLLNILIYNVLNHVEPYPPVSGHKYAYKTVSISHVEPLCKMLNHAQGKIYSF